MIIRLITTTSTPVRITRLEKSKNISSDTGNQFLESKGWYILMNTRANNAVKIISLMIFPFHINIQESSGSCSGIYDLVFVSFQIYNLPVKLNENRNL
jgi:hypothetical protein